ncbi:hypothetical protein WG68_13830 [Arsukibacterium ikkense]|uniref:Uncharacterized protein n=2 Tax=Arsukibacterium ikkense TaxID=336831 RepID=A0A0M2V3A8_9GAMM|nr:hypothetical protein WG68_13830 [Arsukibacterium ikkense]
MLLLLLPLALQARPLSVQQQNAGDQRQYSYHFMALEREVKLQFSFSHSSIRRNSNLVQVYVPEVMAQQVWAELQQQARAAGPYRLTPGPGRDLTNFQLVSAQRPSQQMPNQANTAQQQLRQQLLAFRTEYQQHQLKAAGYQLLQLPDNRQQITVDHVSIVEQSLTDIRPLTAALHSELLAGNQRQFVQFLLTWLQQIPPHPTAQREYGRYFKPPLTLLAEHYGDSASNVVLLATLLRSSLPHIKQAILYLPEHTLLALAIAAGPDELTVNLEGTTYLVLDPSDPRQPGLGAVATPLQLYIFNQFFAYRLF